MHVTPPEKPFGFEKLVFCDHRYAHDHYDEFLKRNMPEGGGGYWGGGVGHNDWTARPFHLPEELHNTNWTIHEAQQFLQRRDTSRPLFMVVSFVAAHPPLVPPAFYMDRYIRTGVPNPAIGDWAVPPPNGGIGLNIGGQAVDLKGEALLSARAGYYGLINHLDDQIHRLLYWLPMANNIQPRDTVTVYTSDHGEMLGDHYMWRKSVPYQGSVRIPFLMSFPHRYEFPRGQVLEQPVCLEDLMPTLLETAGAPIPDSVEGRSLLPLLRGDTPEWRDFIHIERGGQHHTLTDGREKYIWFTKDGREQFFRLTDDPTECHDLAPEPGEADRIAAWRSRLIEQLEGRPEGFTDGKYLIPGRPYPDSAP